MPSLMNHLSIEKIDILKVDIEGAEMQLFSANTEWLNQVDCILIEVHDSLIPGASSQIKYWAESYGFSVTPFGEGFAMVKKDVKNAQ